MSHEAVELQGTVEAEQQPVESTEQEMGVRALYAAALS